MTDPACSDPNCSYRIEVERRCNEAEQRANEALDMAAKYKAEASELVLKNRDLVSKLERLKPRF